MPRSKNPDKFPSVFKDLLLAAFAAGETGITWKCPNKRIAQRTRMQLYAYVNAVDFREDSIALPDELREAKRLHQIQITVGATEDGAFIKLLNKNFAPENLAIQAALSDLGPLSPDTPEDIENRAKAARIIAEHMNEIAAAATPKLDSSEPAVPENKAVNPEGDLSSLFTKT